MKKRTSQRRSGIMIPIPGKKDYRLTALYLDFNGTLARDGKLIAGVKTRLRRLATKTKVTILTADTHGSVRTELAGLPVEIGIVREGPAKARFIEKQCDPGSVAAIGNGANDLPLFRIVDLPIGVIGAEGAAPRSLNACAIVTRSILDALDLLLFPKRLIGTLRT